MQYESRDNRIPDAPVSPGGAQAPKRARAETDPPADERPAKGSNRRKKACEVCRMRKIKCDARRPACELCQSTGLQCRYTDNHEPDMTWVPLCLELQNTERLQCSICHGGLVPEA